MGSRILIHNLGYPRMGALRQLKKTVEAYWKGTATEADLHQTASGLRRSHWGQQKPDAPSKAKFIVAAAAESAARERIHSLLDSFPVYPEIDLECLTKHFCCG